MPGLQAQTCSSLPSQSNCCWVVQFLKSYPLPRVKSLLPPRESTAVSIAGVQQLLGKRNSGNVTVHYTNSKNGYTKWLFCLAWVGMGLHCRHWTALDQQHPPQPRQNPCPIARLRGPYSGSAPVSCQGVCLSSCLGSRLGLLTACSSLHSPLRIYTGIRVVLRMDSSVRWANGLINWATPSPQGRPAIDESFRLPVLDPDVKIGLFVCF